MESKHRDIRLNEDGYFSFKGYLQLLEIPLNENNFVKNSCFLIINGVRNMGKSYGVWDYIINDVWIKSNYEIKIAYLRQNREKIKTARESFNNKYYYDLKQFYMSEKSIYKVSFDEYNKEIREKRKEIGGVFGVDNEVNFKSGIYQNYQMVFFDEYNEENQKLNYEVNTINKFCNLLKTIKRKTEPFFVVLIGNKNTADSDYLTHFGIEILYDELKEDVYENIDNKIYFLDIGDDTFKHLNTNQDLVNYVATYNNITDKYFNKGGYLVPPSKDIRIYWKRIIKTKNIIHYLGLKGSLFEYGTFYDELTNQNAYYIHLVYEPQENKNIIALDSLSYLTFKDSYKLWEMQDYKEKANALIYKSRNNLLFYTMVSTKKLFQDYITILAGFVDG